ncbi:MAG: Ig-like domain-containing protein, partial [Candidatus Bipolaricaulia bacterium]
MSRRLVLLALVLLGVLGCAAGAVAQYPDCGFNCTAGDVTVEGARIEVSESACVLGEDVPVSIYATFHNGTKATRYAIRVLGDLYVNGTAITSLDTCIAESLPPGSHEYLLTTETIPCSARVEFRFVIVSWSASAESCGDEPNCSERKAKCWQPSGGTVVVQVPALVIGFTSDSPACLGRPVRFTSTTSGGKTPYQYQWEFGDGMASTEANPSHTYAAAGDYTVFLTVRDAAGATGTALQDVVVLEPPFATAENGGPYCPGQTIELYAEGGVTYKWTGPSGFSSTLQNPTIPGAGAASAGSYTVTVGDAYGCSSQATTIVSLDATPPMLSVPPDATFECGEAYDPSIAGEATAIDDEDPAPSVTYSDLRVVGDCGGAERVLRTWMATDACGNRAMAAQTITLVDTTPPALSIFDATLECDGAGNQDGIADWLASAVATDGCGTAAIENDFAGVSDRCPGTGTTQVTFTASDACGNATEVRATLSIVDSTAPDAADDRATTYEDHAILVQVLANDSDLCPGELTIVEVSPADSGSASVVGEAIEYVPSDDMNGKVEFQYTIEDCAGHRDVALVRITVTPVNDAPTATDQTGTVSEDGSLDLELEGADVDGDALTFAVADGPSHGTLVGFDPATGAVTYVPNPDYNGSDSFTFTVCDPSGACAMGTVTLVVEAVNDAPTAVDRTETVSEDGSISGQFEGTDPDGDPLTFALVTGPTHGTLVDIDPVTGTATYVPNPNYHGTETFTFTACDPSGACDTGTITLVVTPLNDAPEADDQMGTVDEDGSLSLQLGGTDIDGDELTLVIASGPTHGTLVEFDPATGAVMYVPNPDYHGQDSFTFTACDPSGACVMGTVTLVVEAVNDAPTAVDQTGALHEDESLLVLLVGADADGDTLTYAIVTGPTHGAIAGFNPETGEAAYVPDANYHGADSFTFTVCDSSGACDTGTVALWVAAVDDAPTAVDQSGALDEDGRLALRLEGTSVDGGTLTYAIVTGPAHGTLAGFDAATGGVVYIPDPNYHGPDSVVFAVCNGAGVCDTGTITLYVNAVNDAPAATDQTETVSEDGSMVVRLPGEDVDSDSLTFTVVSGPEYGTLTNVDPVAGTGTYTPNLDYSGSDAFTFQVCDPSGACDTGTITLVVTPVNDAPTAADRTGTVSEDGSLDLELEGADVDGDALTFAVADGPSHGTLVGFDPATGAVTYVPNPDYNG